MANFIYTLDPSTQPLFRTGVPTLIPYTLDPRTQPLVEEFVPPPPPTPVRPLQFGGGRVPPRPVAECTWEEFLADPERCRYAKITNPPTAEGLKPLVPEGTSATKITALAMGLRMADGDTYDVIAGFIALRVDDD